MAVDENKTLVRRIFEEGFNERNLAIIDDLVASAGVNYSAPAGPQQGPGALKGLISMLATAFPDFTMRVEEVIGEGDTVAVRTTLRGTHTGPYLGIAPTGKSFTVEQIHMIRCAGGRAADHWMGMDTLSLLQQLGLATDPRQVARV